MSQKVYSGMQVHSQSLRLDIDDVSTTIDARLTSLHTDAQLSTCQTRMEQGGLGRSQWCGSVQELTELSQHFAAKVPEGFMSSAELQGFFMRHKRNPTAAIAHAEDLFKPPATKSS
jgi:hypothetical protein